MAGSAYAQAAPLVGLTLKLRTLVLAKAGVQGVCALGTRLGQSASAEVHEEQEEVIKNEECTSCFPMCLPVLPLFILCSLST